MRLYAATTYAALAQVAMPWFRSAGMYAAQLRRTADAIDRFVLRMQDESLAHTQYAPETVLDQRVWPILNISDPERGEPKKVWDPYPTYAVGAFVLGIPATEKRLGAAALRDFAMVAARFAAGASLFRQVDAVLPRRFRRKRECSGASRELSRSRRRRVHPNSRSQRAPYEAVSSTRFGSAPLAVINAR